MRVFLLICAENRQKMSFFGELTYLILLLLDSVLFILNLVFTYKTANKKT